MFYKNYYEDLKMTHPFKESRSYGFHTGTDYFSMKGKNQDFINNIDGVLFDIGIGRDSGKYITIKHNPGIIGKEKNIFFSRFKHLNNIDTFLIDSFSLKNKKKFIPAGFIVGKFGNSGYCMTYDENKKKYRFLTEDEKKSQVTLKGVHGHIEYFQPCQKYQKTSLMNAIDEFYENEFIGYYFYQWGNVYFQPESIYGYLQR